MTSLSDSSVSTATSSMTEDPGFASHTKVAMSDVGSAVKADAQELRFQAEDYVVEHPLQTVGIALGVGFLLGVLWSR